MGKEEMWYVVDAHPEAKIYAGLRQQHTPQSFRQFVGSLTAADLTPFRENVATYDSKPGDVYHLPAGRVHALGAGNLVAEIQQTSDITYRVFDFCRLDAYGNPRALHVDLAMKAIDYAVEDDYRTRYDRTAPHVRLVSSPFFEVDRIVVEGAATLPKPADRFLIVMCLSGEANIAGTTLAQGHTLLIPASSDACEATGNATLLTATVSKG